MAVLIGSIGAALVGVNLGGHSGGGAARPGGGGGGGGNNLKVLGGRWTVDGAGVIQFSAGFAALLLCVCVPECARRILLPGQLHSGCL